MSDTNIIYPLVITGFVLGISAFIGYVRNSLKEKIVKLGKDGELSVPDEIKVDWLDTDDRRDRYENMADELYDKYGKDQGSDHIWMQLLPKEEKEKLKFLLMARIVLLLSIYEKVEDETTSMQKLYQTNVISKQYWDSCLLALACCKYDLEYLQKEMVAIDPDVKPQTVFREAWQIIGEYGPQWPENKAPTRKLCPPGCQCETSQRLRKEAMEKNCPPDCECESSQFLRREQEAIEKAKKKKEEKTCPPGCDCDNSQLLRKDAMEKTKNCPPDCDCETSQFLRRELEALKEIEEKRCPPGCDCETSQLLRKEAMEKTKNCPPDCDCELSQFLRRDLEALKAKEAEEQEAEKKALAEGIKPEVAKQVAQVMIHAAKEGHTLSPQEAFDFINEGMQRQILGPFGDLKEDGFIWRQTPPPDEKVQILLEVPTEAIESQVEIEFTNSTMKFSYEDEEMLHWEFHEKIDASKCTWAILDDVAPPIEVGDEVILSGLSTSEYNGLGAIVEETPADVLEKGRWKVTLDDERELSIKAENMIVQSPKGRLQVTLIKEKSAPWSHPAWESIE